ncbi:GGDEF domain-containing protein [Pararhizobium mangrovi]|uniref:diguanylate cyclase n=1 Tax=Pararhizobium mangrovi TaxID=2590452 RepID=A0A506UHW5_9HYPH|nr:GGDEF domain-containing protein [Pararhizobium mangrovi]TPW32911.1 GGDEF domain-containing protein [Pararhizobium mangrovi]
MRIHKAEVFFIFLMAFIALAGTFSFMAHNSIVAAATSGQPSFFPARSLSFLGTIFCGLAAVCGMFLVYPVVRRGLTEQGELQQLTERLSARSTNLEHAATTDALTGTFNRRYFDRALAEYLKAFRDVGKPVGMMILDLDHFKAINDTHGHDVGDDALRHVAACLLEFARYHDVVARYGGEEFAVLSPNTTERQLFALAERIRAAIAGLRIVHGDDHLRLTASIGIAVWDGSESCEDLYRRTDKQLYEAKRRGRDRVC